MEKEWGKLVHVGSSLPSKPEQYALFVGRWQPLHDGHKALFARALDEGKNVWIAIRDIAPDEKNPWTAEEVLSNITNEYRELCDKGWLKLVSSLTYVQLSLVEELAMILLSIPPAQVAEISATKIREKLKNGK